MKTIKISEMSPSTDLKGLSTLGVNSADESVKISLEFLADAAEKAVEAASSADGAKKAADEANAKAGELQNAIDNAKKQTADAKAATDKATNAAQSATEKAALADESAKKADTATAATVAATTKADKATASANAATSEATSAAKSANDAADTANKAANMAEDMVSNRGAYFVSISKSAYDRMRLASELDDNTTYYVTDVKSGKKSVYQGWHQLLPVFNEIVAQTKAPTDETVCLTINDPNVEMEMTKCKDKKTHFIVFNEPVTRCNELFNTPKCQLIEKIDLTGLDITHAPNLDGFLSGAPMQYIRGFETFDTSKSTEFIGTFSNVKIPGVIDISSWDMSNYKQNIYYGGSMFEGCKAREIHMPDLSNLKWMCSMFKNCENLEVVDAVAWPQKLTGNQSLHEAFLNCKKLRKIDLRGMKYLSQGGYNWGAYSMFEGCSSLEEVNWEGCDFTELTDMNAWFKNCVSLKEIDFSALGKWPSKALIDGVLQGCQSLTRVKFGTTDMSNNTLADTTFEGCVSLTDIEGELSGIKDNFSVADCPLTLESLKTIIKGLDPKADAKTLTISEAEGKLMTDNKLTLPGTWVKKIKGADDVKAAASDDDKKTDAKS